MSEGVAAASGLHRIPDLSSARILVTNDDGIHAPGLKTLETIARALSDDVWVVAPEQEQSGAGHSLTLRRPLRERHLSERRFAVDGTPTDCVLLGVHHILGERKPDIVLSGVNRGGNLGEDVTYSGTIAAAMEGALIGLPAIALSQCCEGEHPVKWHTAETHGPGLVRRLAEAGWPMGVLINVNFPDVVAGSVVDTIIAEQGRREAGVRIVEDRDPRGRPICWIGDYPNHASFEPGTDLWAVREGLIAVTPLHLDLTHGPTRDSLKQAFPDRLGE